MGISINDLNTLKVAEIKDHLKRLELPTQGFKKELVDRLKEGMEAKGLTELFNENGEKEEENKEPTNSAEIVEETEVPIVTIDMESGIAVSSDPPTAAVSEPAVTVSETGADFVKEKEVASSKDAPVILAKPVEPELTLEEIKTKVLEHITDSIRRAEKFNELDKLKRLTKDKQRIEKFGISEENPIAVELGLIKPKPVKSTQENAKKFSNKKKGGNRKRHHPYNNNRK
ncbi:hypothetical protein QEN19_003072 [Hanseniaspora menglaensis]